MKKRRKLSSYERKTVYIKTNGHCAYCGSELKYNDMTVDHIVPLNGWSESGCDTLENMLPSCRSCNKYKSGASLEAFRKRIEAQPDVLMRDNVTFQIAVRYKLVQPKPHKVIFYFEKDR